MSAPEMNRRLLLEAPERLEDGAGGFSEIWVALGHVWAAVEPRGAGRELDQAARMQLKITMRWVLPGAGARPDAAMRFVDGDRVYRIEAVHEGDTQGRTLVCYAVEEVGR
ncbi:phage head closure protein [Roseicyclus marinus]|uniref:phage head closure protein n=1 Tax=Roseicyclus marinus TaxID=2161673 RepID=UPI00240F183E|nr:phage head closure protein [Roseicyclus marinus]MDG3042871.1 phage head closure protein [Roseicyclus marinus]